MFFRPRSCPPASSRPRRKSFFSLDSFFGPSSHERRRLLVIEPLEYRVLLSAVPAISAEAANSQTTIGSGFSYPSAVAVDASGDVFVADAFHNEIKEVLPNGSIKTLASGFNVPTGVAVDTAGDVFVADEYNNEVKEILTNGTIKTIGFGFMYPAGVAVDATGDVFVADAGNNAVREVLPNGSLKALGSGFHAPYGVAVDASGDVFVADTDHSAVKEVLPNGTIKTIGSGFNKPHGVAVDASGNVFVADTDHSAVKEVLPNGTIKTIGSGFSFPAGVAVDASGDVFVADSNNSRIVEVAPTSASPPVLAIGGAEVTYNTGGPHIAVAPNATLSSGDGDFAKASLSIVNTNGGQSDRLGVRASGSLTVSGTTLSYSGTAIGTFTGGAYKTPLAVTFNASATQAAILAVAKNVTLWNTTLDPGSLANRSVTFQLTDGAGNQGAAVTQTVKFATPPILAIGGAAVTYTPGGLAIAVAPAATLSTGDGKFAKSSLSVVDTTFASYQSDRLSIGSSGSLVVQGASLVYNNVTIGSFTGGSAGKLTISFNASASEAEILAVARNVTFSSASATPTIANRSIKFQLTDGAGNLGAPVTQTVKLN